MGADSSFRHGAPPSALCRGRVGQTGSGIVKHHQEGVGTLRILVTGATGFIGAHFCHRLIKAGHEVVALVRNPEKAGCLPTERLHILRGDLSLFKDPELLLPACDKVVHLAGIIAAQSQAQYHEINFHAVQDLVKCLQRQSWRPSRFLFASTLAAAGPIQADQVKSEQDPDEPIEAYGESKLRAERYLMERAPFPVTSFRPGAVYGPGDRAFLTVFKMAARGYGIRVAGRDPGFSYIYVDDLVDVMMKLLDDDSTRYRTYFTVYDQPTTIGKMWNLLAKEMNRKVRLLPIPPPILYLLMLGSTAMTKVLPIKNQLDHKQYKQLTASAFQCSSQAVQDDFDWKPKNNIEACIKNTAAGYREAGWL